jgi:hypothetical protein
MDLIYAYSHIAAWYRHKAAMDWSHFAEYMERAGIYDMSTR